MGADIDQIFARWSLRPMWPGSTDTGKEFIRLHRDPLINQVSIHNTSYKGIVNPLEWALSGVCHSVGGDQWVKDEGRQGEKELKAMCNGTPHIHKHGGDPVTPRPPCPVREQCLAWALKHDEWGIWGGTTKTERERIKNNQSEMGKAS